MSIKLRYWNKRIHVRPCYTAVWVENKRSHQTRPAAKLQKFQ